MYNIMFDYEFNGEKKHTMVMGHLTYLHYKMNILYEDYEGSYVKCIISTNVGDFFEEEEEVLHIKGAFRDLLQEQFEKKYMSVRYSIPKYIQESILKHKLLI
jgi:hypothetical protein